MYRPDPEEDPDENVRLLGGLGSNYAARGPPIQLRWKDQVFVPEDPERTMKPVGCLDKLELDYRLLAGLRRAVANGAKISADELSVGSLPSRAKRVPDLRKISLNALYEAQHRMIEKGMIVRVKVGTKCLIRPHDGPKYESETEWKTR